MTTLILESEKIEPNTTASASIIWLHGLGADGHDFADIVPQLNLPENLAVRFIFPHAPIRSVTINNKMQMRAWYDIYSLTDNRVEDSQGMNETQQQVYHLIQQELALGIPAEKIILAGFSQGAAMALYAGLRYSKKLAGILALSTYLPLINTFKSSDFPANQNLPIFIAHGEFDPILRLEWGKQTHDFLRSESYQVEWHAYPMEHQVCLQELRDIRNWLLAVLQKTC